MDDYRCIKCGRPMKDYDHKCEPLLDHAVLSEVRALLSVHLSESKNNDVYIEKALKILNEHFA